MDNLDEPSKPGISTNFEPYGTVPPWTSRLLKVLPDSFPVFEKSRLSNVFGDDLVDVVNSTLQTEPENKEKQVQRFNHNLSQIERTIKTIAYPVEQLRANVEKYYVIGNNKFWRARQLALSSNQDDWVSCELKKKNSLRELTDLRQVFKLMGIGTKEETADTNQVLSVHPSLNTSMKTNDQQLFQFAVALSKRWKLGVQLLKKIDFDLEAIRISTLQQQRFIRIICELRHIWNIQKIPYAAHLYEKGDDYPYRAETRIKVFEPPTYCWGFDQPPKWSLPSAGATSIAMKQDSSSSETPAAPFLCWLPFPSVPPTAPATAHVFFTNPSDNDSSNKDQLGVKIQWIGDSAHSIEEQRLLHIQIVLVSVNYVTSTNQPAPDESKTKDNYFVADTVVNTPESLLPDPIGINENWTAESKGLHCRLQAAQWYLVDRMIHLVLQAQAARLKQIFDLVLYGSTTAARDASEILKHFEQLKLVTDDDNTETDGTRDHPTQITIERWETFITSIAIQNLPIYVSGAETPVFTVDVEIWIEYIPQELSKEKTNNNRNNTVDFRGDGSSSVNKKEHRHHHLRKQFESSLPFVGALAVCYLRNELLTAWKTATQILPTESFDLHHQSVSSVRDGKGGKLTINFLNWIQVYLSKHVLR